VWNPNATWSPQGMASQRDPRPADLEAMSRVKTAAIISIIGAALGVAVPIGASAGGYFRIAVPMAGGTYTFNQTAVLTILGVALAGFALSMLAFWFYRAGFLALRSVDQRFSSTPTWALLAIVGLILVWVGLAVVLASLASVFSCAVTTGPSTRIPVGCVNLGEILGGAGLLLVGGIILLIGYIGMLVGIWRLGDRYGDSLFKIGAVLFIIPFGAIVGQILVLVAATNARKRIEQPPVSPYAPSVPMPPAPPMR
jgi:uncharacterized protein DUF973